MGRAKSACVLAGSEQVSRADLVLRTLDVRSAGTRERDHDDSIPERISTGPEHLRTSRANRDRRSISQVTIAVRQAESDPALSTVESGTAVDGVSRLRAAVSR